MPTSPRLLEMISLGFPGFPGFQVARQGVLNSGSVGVRSGGEGGCACY